MKKVLCLLLACLMLVGCFTACGDKNTQEPANNENNEANEPANNEPADTNGGDAASSGSAFKLGGTGPLTGGAAIYGMAAKQGAEIAVEEINAMGIGPQGFGGQTTCLGLSIEAAPTHVAGLPVAVNVSCHVTRRATAQL